MKKKSFVGSKILVIVLSLILLLNGLGLIVAGTRTKKKNWIVFGILYIVLEWVCYFIGSDIFIIIALLISVVSIIHTALILGMYGNLLNERMGVIGEEAVVNGCEQAEHTSSQQVKTVKQEAVENNNQSIRIPIGKATIERDKDGKPQIIISSKGEYEFFSNGYSICEARVNDGTICKYE